MPSRPNLSGPPSSLVTEKAGPELSSNITPDRRDLHIVVVRGEIFATL
ncbi:Uncharacterised protein [Mycobacteroides abscessus subsp. abscessus]|nr:Uncharacterised protein [Mycobacteroides abscessus subsp. abscessus]